jgi:SET domain-containing protein
MLKSRKKIIESVKHHTKTRLKPSTVCDGVGVFALKHIKAGENIFPDLNSDNIFIEWTEIDDADPAIINYLNSLCNTNKNGFFLARTPNEINISYYINHSDNDNVSHNIEEDVYIAKRDIRLGEELLCKYNKQEKESFTK